MLKDTPHGKAGSVWSEIEDEWEEDSFYLFDEKMKGVCFPKSTFSDWFEPIKEMKPFTKGQVVAIYEAINDKQWVDEERHEKFKDWLDENTEK